MKFANLPLTVAISLLVGQFSTAQAQIEKFAPFIGNWEGTADAILGFEGMKESGQVRWETRWRWLSNKTAVEHTWNSSYIESGKNQSTGTQVFYLDAETKKVVTTGFGVDGEDTQWSNTGKVDFVNKGFTVTISEKTLTGVKSTYIFKNTKTSRQELQSELLSMVVGGKKVSSGFKHTMKRAKRGNRGMPRAIPAKCPWEWMLGDWTIERSDGTSAKINWVKPRKDADYLHGTWIESDGSVQNELISWQSDRGHLVANSHGPSGSFVAIDMPHVERHMMRGTLSKRDSDGNILNGVVVIERVSPTEAHTRILTTDGKTLTEVLRAVE